MKTTQGVSLSDVQAAYEGAEGDFSELIMGEQIHIGGFKASMDLAERAGIGAGQHGVDLCCCSGAGMRFLVRFRSVASMVGVDATRRVVERGQQRCQEEGLADCVRFILGDSCDTGLPNAEADFVWGEDAWSYVVDKGKLLAEAVRILRPGGTIAVTDWVEGPTGLADDEAQMFLQFMRFPSLLSIDDYRRLLGERGCEVVEASDTGRFAPHQDLYINMLEMQLTYDALRILGFDLERQRLVLGAHKFFQQLAHAGKIAQGRFIARKR
jgi:SAM-dependent methyltransferase